MVIEKERLRRIKETGKTWRLNIKILNLICKEFARGALKFLKIIEDSYDIFIGFSALKLTRRF